MRNSIAISVFSILLSHILGSSVAPVRFPDNIEVVRQTQQLSCEWHPANYRGLTMGKSTRPDMIRVFGEPKRSEVFEENKADAEHWYHYDGGGDFPGEMVFNVDKKHGVIRRITIHPKRLSEKEAIRHFGEDFIITRYEFCPGFEEQESAPLVENLSGQFRYIEYRKRGIALAIGDNEEVEFILYVSAPVGTTASKCRHNRVRFQNVICRIMKLRREYWARNVR